MSGTVCHASVSTARAAPCGRRLRAGPRSPSGWAMARMTLSPALTRPAAAVRPLLRGVGRARIRDSRGVAELRLCGPARKAGRVVGRAACLVLASPTMPIPPERRNQPPRQATRYPASASSNASPCTFAGELPETATVHFEELRRRMTAAGGLDCRVGQRARRQSRRPSSGPGRSVDVFRKIGVPRPAPGASRGSDSGADRLDAFPRQAGRRPIHWLTEPSTNVIDLTS